MTDERTLQTRIERGDRIESVDEMTPEYRDNVVHLMTMQADSELAGGYGYVPWITKAPTVEEKHVVAQIVKDELRHAAVMYGLLGDLGMDVDAHVRPGFGRGVARPVAAGRVAGSIDGGVGVRSCVGPGSAAARDLRGRVAS